MTHFKFAILLIFSSCLVIVSGDQHQENLEAKLIFAKENSINVHSLNSKKLEAQFGKLGGRTVGVTFDSTQEMVYWTDVGMDMEAIYRSKLDGTEVEAIVTHGLITPEGIAFDWIAQNIYFTDSDLAHIVVCDKGGSVWCAILIQEKIQKPRAIALHPSTGQIFWTDWGDFASISKAGMDGSNPLAVVTEGLKWPNGLVIDHLKLYWVDGDSGVIETSDFNGGSRRIIKNLGKSGTAAFSLDVWDNTIYWSDWMTPGQIQSCDQWSGENYQIFYSSSDDMDDQQEINGLTVYHPNKQNLSQNPCADLPCSHICVISPIHGFLCLCPAGMILGKDDSKNCLDDPKSAKLFLAEGNWLKQIPIDAIGGPRIFSGRIVEGLHTIGSIAYNPINKTFIIFEPVRKAIFVYHPTTQKMDTLVTRHLDSVKGLSVDPVAQNLYWVDAGKRTLEVMSLVTGSTTVLYNDDDSPVDILVVPQIKSMFVAIVGHGQGKILRMSMDGVEIHRLIEIFNGEPTTLTYSHELGHIYWCDPIRQTIGQMALDGHNGAVVVTRSSQPFSLTSYKNKIYWTDPSTPHLIHSMSVGPTTKILETSIAIEKFFPLLGIADDDLMGQYKNLMDTHECSVTTIHSGGTNGKRGCSHICLLSIDDGVGTCMCPEGLKLDPAGGRHRQCVPLKACLSDQFGCHNGRCISMESKCDHFMDCKDGEDELNCTALHCRATDFVCQNHDGASACISGQWRCDGEEDCQDGSDEANCPKKTCADPEAFRCILGRCIPPSWRCDRVIDCPDWDHSDEANCNFTCKVGEFKCKREGGRDCISNDWVCDGERDCLDGSDEHLACFTDCTSADDFNCSNGHCIKLSLVCDGDDDCGDKSDELFCPVRKLAAKNLTFAGFHATASFNSTIQNGTKCPPDKFWCLSGECLDFDQVCDHRADCVDASDEGDDCDEPCGPQNGCSHGCRQTPNGPTCTCPSGYMMRGEVNPKSCEDINECLGEAKRCDHYCQNLKGSFKCLCHHDYVLRSDHVTCKAKGNPPFFIFSQNSTIFFASQDLKMGPKEISLTHPLNGLSVDAHNRIIYWTDVTKNLHRCSIDLNKEPAAEMLIESLTGPGPIAFDWISKNIFIIDVTSQGPQKNRRKSMLKICNLAQTPKNRGCVILYNFGSSQTVTSLTLCPQKGYIFLTSTFLNDFGLPSGLIQRSNMDGSDEPTVLASEKIIAPTGLVVDHIFNKIFWLDARTATVESVNFDGTGRATIVSSGVTGTARNLVILDARQLLWTDQNEIVALQLWAKDEKDNNHFLRVKMGNLTDIENFVIFQQALQPTGEDPCQNNLCNFICTGKATHHDLLTRTDPSLALYKCFCPIGFQSMDPHNFNCTPSLNGLMTKLGENEPNKNFVNFTLNEMPKWKENETKMAEKEGKIEEKGKSQEEDHHHDNMEMDSVIYYLAIFLICLMFLLLMGHFLFNRCRHHHQTAARAPPPSCRGRSGSSSLELYPLKLGKEIKEVV